MKALNFIKPWYRFDGQTPDARSRFPAQPAVHGFALHGVHCGLKLRKIFALSFVIVVAGLLLAPALHAQGCAMCYTTAAGQDPAAARRLDMAILALLLPVLSLFAGVLTLAIKRRDGPSSDPSSQIPATNVSAPPLSAAGGDSARAATVVHLHLELPPS